MKNAKHTVEDCFKTISRLTTGRRAMAAGWQGRIQDLCEIGLKRIETDKEKEYSLNEVIVDITYLAGKRDYYSGDSRADVQTFITWAQEFEKKYEGIDWGDLPDDHPDYMEAVDEFAEAKLDAAIAEQVAERLEA